VSFSLPRRSSWACARREGGGEQSSRRAPRKNRGGWLRRRCLPALRGRPVVGWGTRRGGGTTRRWCSTREAQSRLLGRDCNTPPWSKYHGGQRGAAPVRRRRRAGPRRRRPRCTATRSPGFLAARGPRPQREGAGRRAAAHKIGERVLAAD
jgi:hypothetical protein